MLVITNLDSFASVAVLNWLEIDFSCKDQRLTCVYVTSGFVVDWL